MSKGQRGVVMKSVMLTIRLKWFYLTYKGIKTVEVRKSCPKNFDGDVFEVVSKTNFEKDLLEIPENEREFFRQFKGKVGLKFTLNKVEEIQAHFIAKNNIYGVRYYICKNDTKSLSSSQLVNRSCLTNEEINRYLNSIYERNICGYAWHISNLEIFDKPKELREFYKCECIENTTLFDKERHFRPYLKLTKAPQSWCYVEE